MYLKVLNEIRKINPKANDYDLNPQQPDEPKKQTQSTTPKSMMVKDGRKSHTANNNAQDTTVPTTQTPQSSNYDLEPDTNISQQSNTSDQSVDTPSQDINTQPMPDTTADPGAEYTDADMNIDPDTTSADMPQDMNQSAPDEYGDDMETEEEIPDEDKSLKELEKELFKTLTPAQLDIKDSELKRVYLSMCDNIDKIIENISRIPRASDNIAVIEFISSKLDDLKDVISYYLENVYPTKSYIENSENIQYYVVILSNINELLKEINPKNK